jgi:ribose transport system substrate-binding protein
MRVEGASPNWNTNTGAQAVTSLISEKPAVMVIDNPDVRGADECPVYVDSVL